MSNNFEIVETQKFLNSYEKVLGPHWQTVYSKIKNIVYPQLRDLPFIGRNIKKIKGYSPPTWRYRLGDYRLFYEISVEQKIIIIVSIHHRKNAY